MHSAPYMGSGRFFSTRDKKGRNLKVTALVRLVPRFRIREAIAHFTLCMHGVFFN